MILVLSVKTKIIVLTLTLVLIASCIVGLSVQRLAIVHLLRGDASTLSMQTLTVIVATFFACGLVTIVFSFKLMGPVDDLIIGTQLVAEGKLDHSIRSRRNDELGRLVDSFNRMIVRLRQSHEESSKLSDLATVEKQKAELIIDSMADSVIVTDKTHRITLFNPAAERLFDVASRKVLGKNIVYLLKKDRIHELFADYPDLKEQVLPVRKPSIKVREFELTKQGRKVIRATIAPLRNESHLVIGTVAVFEDITKERELDQMKTEFVSTVSHELRTPLTSIKGYAALLAEGRLGELSEQQKKSVDIINQESDRLANLINDILDLSRMEVGKARMSFTFTDITTCIDDNPILNVARSKEIAVRKVQPTAIPKVLTDKPKLVQVFTNLLSNAVKFTKPGGTITVKFTNKKEYVQVDITDTGIGIPKKEIPKLFNKFYQVESHLTRYQGGSGLGLPIVKEIIGLHHGLISIRSKVNRGTTVSFSLPKYPLSESELVKCWERKACRKLKCPAYESNDRRCWLFVGTRCKKGTNEPCLDKIEVCSYCDIYRRGLRYDAKA